MVVICSQQIWLRKNTINYISKAYKLKIGRDDNILVVICVMKCLNKEAIYLQDKSLEIRFI